MARCFGVGRWVCVALVASLFFGSTAPAQDLEAARVDETGDVLVLEEVIVTGTRIVRRDFMAPSPVATLDRDEILSAVQPTLEDALNRMPQVTPDFGRTSNNPGNGKSRVNLRGLGANRTLVVVNGRRFAPAGLGNQVDVNTIPQALVERVEIVTGGASTVYGSDAVSGVINFITRQDYEGLEVEASAYTTEEGDSEVYDGDISWGQNFAGGRGNISLFAGYLERRESFAGEREISSVPLFDTFEGEILQSGSIALPAGFIGFPPADLGDGPVEVTFTPEGLPVAFVFPDDLYNFAPINYLQVPLEREYGGFFLNYEVSDRVEFYSEFIFTHNEGAQNLAAVPARVRASVNLDNPVLSPQTRQLFAEFYAPPGSDIAQFLFIRRLEELGPRITSTDNDYLRGVAGLRGDLGDGWEYDLWVTYTDSDEEQLLKNDASRSRFLQGLRVDPATGQCFDPTGGCVPVDPFGAGTISPEALAFIGFPPYSNLTSRKQELASAYVRGEPFDSWAGPVPVALGLEWRSDSGDFAADEALFSGDALGYGGSSSVVGEESVWEIYGEAVVPLAGGLPWAQRLELELGGRLSEYDHAGSTDSWKLGLGWELTDALRFRTMVQRSVRAPDLVEAFEVQRVEDGFFASPDDPDPCSASQDPVGRGFADRCIAQGIPAEQIGVFEATNFYPMDILAGGNPDLQAETGDTWTAGMVYAGLENWMFSVDYFDLSIEDAIGQANNKFVCFDPDNTEAALCDRIRRDPVNYNVVQTDFRTINLGSLQTRGFDFQASYATDLPEQFAIGDASAAVSVDLIWTHVTSLSFQENPAVPEFECAGTFGFPCSQDNVGATTPENRLTAFTQYSSGNLGVILTWRWLEGTDTNAWAVAEFEGIEDPIFSIPTVPSKHYFDLGVSYAFAEHIEARLNVANLLDTDPPLMADGVIANNTDTLTYDIFGRAYRLSIRFRY